ncbi:MAG: radical SAM protein [Firmicutes bacterium]|nr:radical SAM protein [Bacillota bacterium]
MPWDVRQAPHVITWEVTRACQLHCRHCRAKAIRHRNPAELTLAEIEQVLEDIRDHFDPHPLLIFTGGDPTERDDLLDILRASVQRGLSTAVAPSVTPNLTPAVLDAWREVGVRTISLSIDGPSPAVHDTFRGVPGTFLASLAVARAIKERGFGLQVNTAVDVHTVDSLPEMGALARDLGVASWEVFFVVPTGRARQEDALSPEAMDRTLAWLATYAQSAPYRVTAVAAPQYRRVMLETIPGLARPRTPAVREAQGFAFIDHTGEVYPSGYLPVSGGNVRRTPLSTIYRESPLFVSLRDPDALKGKCGTCPYRDICGGSRARAYAVHGDVLAEDPGCPYSAVMAV